MANITAVYNRRAYIVTDGETTVLVSYSVPVVAVKGGTAQYSKQYAKYSATTKRHVRQFMAGRACSQVEEVDHTALQEALYGLIGVWSID